ncbi:hypothetical protein bthur0005_58060 [Bacillus thuringiensis serovar pakistani str. T13001]|nr:hypothetical protein bthur0005_58060 [Bacillus thuringiensis serovar pakistani str. T13001]
MKMFFMVQVYMLKDMWLLLCDSWRAILKMKQNDALNN